MSLVFLHVHVLCPQTARKINDTVIQFSSPAVNSSIGQHFKTYIHLDNWVKELKPFHYHPNPTFHNLTKNIITEASIIIVTVSSLWALESCKLHAPPARLLSGINRNYIIFSFLAKKKKVGNADLHLAHHSLTLAAYF